MWFVSEFKMWMNAYMEHIHVTEMDSARTEMDRLTVAVTVDLMATVSNA